MCFRSYSVLSRGQHKHDRCPVPLYHNKHFDIQHTPCSCADDTRHIRFDLHFAGSDFRCAFRTNEQAFLQQLLSYKLRTLSALSTDLPTDRAVSGVVVPATGPPESNGDQPNVSVQPTGFSSTGTTTLRRLRQRLLDNSNNDDDTHVAL